MNSGHFVERKAGEPGAFRRIVMRALGLDPAFREVFLLCDVQGFTIAETAHILDTSSAQVAEKLHQARCEMNATEGT